MATNFHLAPPAKIVDGLLAVPMDSQTITGSLRFDGATSSASADVTISFITGSQNGCPVFDLRQTIQSAWLDGAAIAVGTLVHHDFGGGADAQLRIINRVLSANTSHTLRLVYAISLPQAPLGGSYPPTLSWTAGPRLTFNFGFTDLRPGRYLESWIPANLIYDQFALTLDIQVVNTPIVHEIISNGSITGVAINHWTIVYPDRFTALSPLLEIRALDALRKQTGTHTLPVSGTIVTIEAWKPASSDINLATQINAIKGYLTANENSVGKYIHGSRFVVFFAGGGMEYEGGTTTAPGSLSHETFHSWWARGIKPPAQPDGWWDEAWTTYFNDGGGATSAAFNFTDAPIELSPRNPWVRITNSNAYSDGSRFWAGVSSLVGNANLKAYMRDLYQQKKGSFCTTTELEEYLLCQSGKPLVVDAFHRFVFGFSDPATIPDLWLKDDTLDTAGNNDWSGRFWDSPDVWVRNRDDDGTTHQNAEFGQDNWIYARVRNKSATLTVKHFVVAFNVKQFAGTQFSYPADFLPCMAAVSGFDLGPGATKIVKAKWPKNKIPAAGTHGCLLAAVITRREHPVAQKHVWESNNLAQKNLTIVDVKPNVAILLPFVLANHLFPQARKFGLEVIKSALSEKLQVSLLHATPQLFSGFERIIRPLPTLTTTPIVRNDADVLDCCGAPVSATGEITDSTTEAQLTELVFKPGLKTEMSLPVVFGDQLAVQLKIQLPSDAKVGDTHQLDLVQRDSRTKQIVGGVAVLLNVVN